MGLSQNCARETFLFAVPVLVCNNTCTDMERCVPDDGSSLAQANLGELPRCVLTNGK